MKTKNFQPWLLMAGFLAIFFWAVKNLLGPGFFQNHDGAFHLIRLWQFDKAVRAGIFPVRWLADLNMNNGSPVLNFFYPLPYYLAELVHLLGFSLGSSLKLVVILSLGLSWWAMFFWLKERFNSLAAFLGAVFYLYAPYRFLTAYVSFNLGEAVAFVFPPLVLWSWAKLDKTNKPKYFGLSALLLGLLVLSHNIFAVIFLPIIFIWLLVISKKRFLALLSFILALGLSAYFWLPALGEKKYVNLGHQPAAPYQVHFPTMKQLLYSPWGYGYSLAGPDDGMSFQIGLAHLMVLMLVLAGLIFKWKKDREIWIIVGIFILSFFLMLEQSVFVWQKLVFLAQLQYPWRLLSASVLIVSFLAGWLINKTNSRTLFIILLALVLVANRNHLRPVDQIRHPDAFYLENQALAYGSTDISLETLPVGVLKPTGFPDHKIELSGKGIVVNQLLDRQHYLAELHLEEKQKVTIHTFYFPGWQVFIDDQSVKPDQSTTGLIEFELFSGDYHLGVVFKNTLLRNMANGISLFSLLVLASIILKQV
ncbi:glycosyltransferase family 39 protein [Patescibacteria group bacterium]|nr:glycosyltransferase family 39 protein [Patescibacteria group bacterium]MBU1931214.1 glycosyltransferase family 39 protein [Patescibacteria group bacterium]